MPLQRLLYHFWLSPFARKVRLVLQEKNLDFSMQVEKPWERRPEFVALNPACEVPVLLEPDGTVLAEASAIAEYLDEAYREKLLLGLNPIDRAEVRRLVAWFDAKMNREVTEPLVNEKFMKRFLGFGAPDFGGHPRRQVQSQIPSQLRRLSHRAPSRLAGGGLFLARRRDRRGASLGPRLSRRCGLGRVRAGEGMVRTREIAAELPATPRRYRSGRAAAQALHRSRFLRAGAPSALVWAWGFRAWQASPSGP